MWWSDNNFQELGFLFHHVKWWVMRSEVIRPAAKWHLAVSVAFKISFWQANPPAFLAFVFTFFIWMSLASFCEAFTITDSHSRLLGIHYWRKWSPFYSHNILCSRMKKNNEHDTLVISVIHWSLWERWATKMLDYQGKLAIFKKAFPSNLYNEGLSQQNLEELRESSVCIFRA